jgi:TIR domain
MNEGLENCKYFFFFITSNSLQSEMVKLEWTSTLMQRSSRDIQFIPVRAENVDVPMVISSLKYLDLANQGLEVTKTQMIDIITGDVEEKHFPAFNNLQVYVLQEEDHMLRYFIMANRFYESNAKFALITTLNEEEADFQRPTGIAMTGYNPNIGRTNGDIFLMCLPFRLKAVFRSVS